MKNLRLLNFCAGLHFTNNGWNQDYLAVSYKRLSSLYSSHVQAIGGFRKLSRQWETILVSVQKKPAISVFIAIIVHINVIKYEICVIIGFGISNNFEQVPHNMNRSELTKSRTPSSWSHRPKLRKNRITFYFLRSVAHWSLSLPGLNTCSGTQNKYTMVCYLSALCRPLTGS